MFEYYVKKVSKVVDGDTIDVDIENSGATYDRNPVVVDKNIISCPHYDFMGDWMRIAFETHNKRTSSIEPFTT